MFKVQLVCLFLYLIIPNESDAWGFYAHKLINRHAVFSLPPEMVGFFKRHIDYITDNAVNPDRRRYAVDNEAPRHFIDIDYYGDSAFQILPRSWNMAVAKYGEMQLHEHGIVPWYVNTMKYRLTTAFSDGDAESILRIASDIGHYIADAHVPLHSTQNYNGQLTDQYGIHGFWETRLPELFADEYDLLVGQCEYVPNVQEAIWEEVFKSQGAVDSVLSIEKKISAKFPADKKYSYEERGNTFVQVYAMDYSRQYHKRLNGMVAKRLKASIKMVADLWFTSWVDAGQPDLSKIENLTASQLEAFEIEKKSWLEIKFKNRDHEVTQH
ncbi:MAG: zinc dependent phospholipase C family protein [Bacteroidetes bacterium]|nr:zinc dependent phospholipase C family protein [Bacteroidota bacterium]MDA1119174.1 zinc dependent phospholipase C family protein [Bacteroidota bacterium]